MITRVALVPHPPLLVPELTGTAQTETAALRTAALEAASWLTEETKEWLAVASGPAGASYSGAVWGSFQGYGVDVAVALSEDEPVSGMALPLPALVAGWLRGAAGAASVRVDVVSDRLSTSDCLTLGKSLHDGPFTGVLILGDGSTMHGPKAPGGPDPRAGAFDDGVRAALASASADALAAISPAAADELAADGRAAWQVAGGILTGGGRWAGRLLYSGAPYGVGYHVAVWERL